MISLVLSWWIKTAFENSIDNLAVFQQSRDAKDNVRWKVNSYSQLFNVLCKLFSHSSGWLCFNWVPHESVCCWTSLFLWENTWRGGRVRLTGSWFWDSYKGGPNLETKATYTPQTLPAYPLCQRTQTVMLTHVFKLSENCILDKLSCIVDYCRKANVRNNSVDFPANFKRTNRTKIRSDCSSKTVLSKGGSSNESESRK